MKKFLLLCIPILACVAADVSFTLHGQPSEWWAGNYAAHRELNPVGQIALSYGPFITVLSFCVYAVALCSAAMWMIPQHAGILAITVTFGHILGVHSWCHSTTMFGARLATFAAAMVGICVTEYLCDKNQKT